MSPRTLLALALTTAVVVVLVAVGLIALYRSPRRIYERRMKKVHANDAKDAKRKTGP